MENPENNIAVEELKSELLLMAEEDQAIRAVALETGLLDQTIDKRNTARMKEIVENIGWPTPKMVGNDASHAAWLLVQHADLDPVFQNKCLALMKSCYEQEPDNVLKEHIDKLTVRVSDPIV